MANELLKNAVACVIDYGQFTEVAERLARNGFGRVLFYSPWETSFPTYNEYVVGKGLEGVEKIEDIWPYFDQIDVFVFPDLYHGGMQAWLRQQGKAVFGAGLGETMEIHRDRMKELQSTVGIPTNDYKVFNGIDDLREHLKTVDNKYVKTNLLRGSMESFHHESYLLTEPLLDKFEHSLGIFKDEQTFIVEEPIDAICEIGYDGFVCTGGRYPSKTLFGLEIKGQCYVGKGIEYKDLPNQILDINARLASAFDEYNYAGHYSSEVRVAKNNKEGYLIDQTTRNPSPPTALMLEIIENYPEVIYDIAMGDCPLLRFKYKYGVQVVIKSEHARKDIMAVYFPEKFKDYVKISNHVVKDGINYFVPQNIENEEIGSVVGMGNTIKDAIKQVTEISKEIKGYGISIDLDSLDKAQEQIDNLKQIGFYF